MEVVAQLDDVPENGTLKVAAGGENLLLVRSPMGIFAIENMCSHAYQELDGGKVRKVFIFCPMHGVRFDMRDGCPSGKLTDKSIKVWHVEVHGKDIRVDFSRRLDKGA
ncbi:Rieske (2Fe-2S) protein [Allopontixanthobacter sediminis]|uniref:Rieske 2Fe-2S domain-containing protein n=1 Tax=Allopontixanthobacter sediminis TaxID=1689985 RepID=A0A845ATH7_9SPHN|nr:Rieske 2Fe-2S domain-containing protein [Allopontixanthobacter sediminis]MXP42863.1 Rieske 2Fe-2S domain-containing protein [Allopontixanthobacter sediminis]